MTISNQNSTVTYDGNGITDHWPFTFVIPSGAERVGLFEIAANNLIIIPDTDYSITGLDNPNGGEVIYPLSGPKVSADYRVVIWREVPYTQDTELTNQTPYYPKVLEQQLDRIVMQVQQLVDETKRAVRVPQGADVTDLDLLIAGILALGPINADIQTVAGISGRVVTVADNVSDVSTVALNIAAVSLAASNMATIIAVPALADQVALDRVQTGLDRATTTADRIQTSADAGATGADRVATNADRIATAADRVQTGLDRAAAAASAASIDIRATDVRRNRIVNHDMRVSQENGTEAGTTNGRYPVDQWAQYFTGTGTLTVQQVASVTPAGSPNRLRATVTSPDVSLASEDKWTLTQNLEGSNVVDFQYGLASAKASVLRFGFKGPAGTYAVALHNSAANRSFVTPFTIEAEQANTDTVQTIAIPGDTAGTWLKSEGVIGITLDIVLAAGSSFQGVAGWQAGNILATSTISNGMGTAGAVFELFDVGLRLDPGATGVYGQYEVGEVDADYRSERYYIRVGSQDDNFLVRGRNSYAQNFFKFPIIMAKTPAMAGSINSSAATATSFIIHRTGFTILALLGDIVTARYGYVNYTANARLS